MCNQGLICRLAITCSIVASVSAGCRQIQIENISKTTPITAPSESPTTTPPVTNWQEQLEQNFDIVETFDELQDWSANGLYPSSSGSAQAYDAALLPKKADGSRSKWGYWANKSSAPIVGTIQNGPFQAGETVTNGAGKLYVYQETHVLDGITYLRLYGVAAGSTSGSSTDPYKLGERLTGLTSGASATIMGWPKIIANHGANTWRGTGKSLMMNLGDNDNGAGAMAGIGAQRLGMYFGDGVSGKSGYKKIHLFMLVKFAPTFFGLTGAQADIGYIRVFKFFDICAGFTSIKRFGSDADQVSIEQGSPQTTTEYGANVSIFNINGGGLSNSGQAYFSENVSAAHLTPNSNPPTYYEWANVNKTMRNNDPLFVATGADINQVHPTDAAGDWFAIEVISDIGTPNNSDGKTEFYVYDRTGRIRGHYSAADQLKLVHFDHFYNKITLGGNRRTGVASSGVDGRYWIDDFIVNGSRIGPTYFEMLTEH